MKSLLLALNLAIATLTGVVYQKEHDFIIAETANMKPLATLEGVGFSTGHFANFVGQTVRVKGTLITTKEGKKILRVQKVSDIEKIALPPAAAAATRRP